MENETSQLKDEKSSWKSWLEKLPLLQWIGAAIVGICVTWSTLQVTSANQIYEINQIKNDSAAFKVYIQNLKSDRDKQFDELKREIVTKEVFDERTNMILRNQDLEREERKKDREYFERIMLNPR